MKGMHARFYGVSRVGRLRHTDDFATPGAEISLYLPTIDFSAVGHLETYTVYAVQWEGHLVRPASEDT